MITRFSRSVKQILIREVHYVKRKRGLKCIFMRAGYKKNPAFRKSMQKGRVRPSNDK